jgi:hypothetical protein
VCNGRIGEPGDAITTAIALRGRIQPESRRISAMFSKTVLTLSSLLDD